MFRDSVIPILAGLALTTACSRSGERPVAAATPSVHRGHVTRGHEVRSFRPCGSEDALWLTDESGRLADLHGELAPPLEPYGEMFAVVEGTIGPPPGGGFGADYPGGLRVERVLYAGGEGPGCDYPWSSFRFRALGNEPFWFAEITERGLRVRRPGEPDLEWTGVAERRDGEELRFSAAEPGPVELRIAAGPCRDSMSGAWFAFSAELRLGDQIFTGWALKGD